MASGEQTTRSERVVDCPRCHETCGWCSDYRWYHGTLRLSDGRSRCTLPLKPEGDACPLCKGSRKVRRTLTATYEAVA